VKIGTWHLQIYVKELNSLYNSESDTIRLIFVLVACEKLLGWIIITGHIIVQHLKKKLTNSIPHLQKV